MSNFVNHIWVKNNQEKPGEQNALHSGRDQREREGFER